MAMLVKGAHGPDPMVPIRCVHKQSNHNLMGDLMMMSSNGNIFRVTGYLYWEFTDHRWIPHTKASDAEL